jgi:tetratricopeptide (TPR) repeat protein
MRLVSGLFLVTVSTAVLAPSVSFAQTSATAQASVSISIKADVGAASRAQAEAGDKAAAAGNFEAALSAYGAGFAQTRDRAFIYAMARCHKALGHAAQAKAMFTMYLAASGDAALKFRAEAETEAGVAAKGAVATATGMVKTAAAKTTKVVGAVGAGVYGAVKISVSASVSASAKASAQAADTAYAAGKYEDAARGYLEAYAASQQAVALYAAAQAKAQAGHAVEARALLLGYLRAQPKGKYAKDAGTLLLALGSSTDASVKISVKAKVSAVAKASAGKGDLAFKAGKYLDAAKLYAEAHAQSSADAALLFAQGMAQFYAGTVDDAVVSLKAYLAAGGSLEFKAHAEATIRASGRASS